MLTVENTPKHRLRLQKAGAAAPQKTGRKPAKKNKKRILINQSMSWFTSKGNEK